MTNELQFTEADLSADPLELFQKWFGEAELCESILDPNAMCLSTVGKDGYPEGRIVLMKGLDERGFLFFTNSNSAKGRALDTTPKASIVFFWDPLRRQVRASGDVTTVSEAESDEYFASRERRSQLGAWASLQSEELPRREVLEERLAELERTYDGEPVPRPPHWKGYRLLPLRIEFWQERTNRLHDRFLYVRDTRPGSWTVRRLYP